MLLGSEKKNLTPLSIKSCCRESADVIDLTVWVVNALREYYTEGDVTLLGVIPDYVPLDRPA